MKTALIITEGKKQIVLTPNTKEEEYILGAIKPSMENITVLKGSFYECQGGWYRQGLDDKSTILVLKEKE